MFDIIWFIYHIIKVHWVVEIDDEFDPELDGLHDDVRVEILALRVCSSSLGRSWAASR